MPKSKNTASTDNRKQVFIAALPLTFMRKEAIVIGENLGFRERTIDRILRENDLIKKLDYNTYSKEV